MLQMESLKGVNIRDKIMMFSNPKHNTNSIGISRKSRSEIQSPLRSITSSTNSNSINSQSVLLLNYKTMEELTKVKDIDEKVIQKLQTWLGEGFCEGFFIASFPDKNGKVAEKSQEYLSFCGHQQCGMLPAMEPEIIARYPLKDTKILELNNLAATLCFPLGIKVCYTEYEPETVRNYSTPITNQQGGRYYMMTYHFYHKMINSEFSKKYEMHPLKYQLMKFADGYIGLNIDSKTQRKIEENLALCEELGFREVVYVPYCLCLISKFPFLPQMEKCLQCLYNILSDFSENSSKDINEVIMFLIHSIPIPELNTKLKFYLPFAQKGIEITCPKVKDVNIVHNLNDFFKIFSVDQIVTIFRLMLFEKKILFIGKNYSQLSQLTDNFLSILYPFQWVHTYIPIMSYQMIQYLQTFLPFINGAHLSLMPFLAETLYENEEDVYIIYINREEDKKKKFMQIDTNYNLKPNIKKRIDVEKKINETTPPLPKKLNEKLHENLRSIRDSLKYRLKKTSLQNITNFDNIGYNMKIQNVFIDFFATMFLDYQKYICMVDDYVVFNSKLFIKEKPKEDFKFYSEFTESQLFEQFIQNVLKEDSFRYFNMVIANKKNESTNKIEEETDFNKRNIYYIKPPFLHSNSTDIPQLEKELNEKYKPSETMAYPNGILKEKKRIIVKINPIDRNKFDVNNCKVFLFPEALNKRLSLSIQNTAVLKRVEFYESREKKILEMRKKSYIRRNVDDKELSDKEKDEIKELLRDTIIGIFKSDVSVLNSDKKRIIQTLSTSFGRTCLIKLIGQNNSNVKILNDDAFKLLYVIIAEALISMLNQAETEKNLTQAVSLLKSSLFYGTNQKNLIWNLLCEKQKNFPFLLKNEFWVLWEKTEQIERKSENIQIILINVCNRMLDFQLEKDFIKKTLNELIEREIEQEEECLKLKDIVLELIWNIKYN